MVRFFSVGPYCAGLGVALLAASGCSAMNRSPLPVLDVCVGMNAREVYERNVVLRDQIQADQVDGVKLYSFGLSESHGYKCDRKDGTFTINSAGDLAYPTFIHIENGLVESISFVPFYRMTFPEIAKATDTLAAQVKAAGWTLMRSTHDELPDGTIVTSIPGFIPHLGKMDKHQDIFGLQYGFQNAQGTVIVMEIERSDSLMRQYGVDGHDAVSPMYAVRMHIRKEFEGGDGWKNMPGYSGEKPN